MKYEHATEQSREYKYGPGEEFTTKELAMEQVRKLRTKILTELSLQGFYKAVEKISEVEKENSIKLEIKFKYPLKIFEDV